MLPGPLAACIRRVQGSTPPELSAALAAVEYTRVTEDACRLEIATKLRDMALCDGVAVSAIREVCRARAAIAAGRPEQCPGSYLDRGRDPFCVALAVRSPGLCAAAPPTDRIRCLAVAHASAEQCRSLDPVLQPRCLADVTALRAVVSRQRGGPLPPGTATLTLWLAADRDAAPAERHTLELATRGAYLDPAGTLWLVEPEHGWPSRLAHVVGERRPLVGVAMTMPSRPGRAELRDLRIVLPNGLVVESPVEGDSPRVHLTQVARARGGIVAGTIETRATATGAPVNVSIEFRTFIRDVAQGSEIGHP